MSLPPLYVAFLDHLIAAATPEAILAFKASPDAQAEAHDLLERRSASQLSAAEEQRLQQMLELERFIGLLKARAHQTLQNRHLPR